MTGQMPGDGTFPSPGGPVNGDNDFPLRNRRKIRVHPRLFVRCFGRAVKPYRLLLPAFAPALKAVVRLPRVAGASDRDSLRGPALRDMVPALEDEADLLETAVCREPRFAQVPI